MRRLRVSRKLLMGLSELAGFGALVGAAYVGLGLTAALISGGVIALLYGNRGW